MKTKLEESREFFEKKECDTFVLSMQKYADSLTNTIHTLEKLEEPLQNLPEIQPVKDMVRKTNALLHEKEIIFETKKIELANINACINGTEENIKALKIQLEHRSKELADTSILISVRKAITTLKEDLLQLQLKVGVANCNLIHAQQTE